MKVVFTVEAFTKNKVDIDVLCWKDYAYEEFGYFWFDYHAYEIHTVCFFGDICTKFYEEWSQLDVSAYAGVGVQGYDFPALFSVTVINDGDPDHPVVNSNYGDAAIEAGMLGKPVCVEYLDNLEVDGETYTAFLNLLLPDGTEVLLDEIHFTDADFSDNGDDMEDVSEWGGDDGIWEFAVGDCAMAAQQEDIDAVYNIPWVPLPDEVTFTVDYPRSDCYFGLADIDPNVEVGEFSAGANIPAWCAAHDLTISPNHRYDAYVYPYFNIPSTASAELQAITAEQWAKLNWLANEILPVGTYSVNDIQTAIWQILGQVSGSNAIATAAPSSYVPPLGGYIVVVIDPYKDVTDQTKCERRYYQVTIVRFDP